MSAERKIAGILFRQVAKNKLELVFYGHRFRNIFLAVHATGLAIVMAWGLIESAGDFEAKLVITPFLLIFLSFAISSWRLGLIPRHVLISKNELVSSRPILFGTQRARCELQDHLEMAIIQMNKTRIVMIGGKEGEPIWLCMTKRENEIDELKRALEEFLPVKTVSHSDE